MAKPCELQGRRHTFSKACLEKTEAGAAHSDMLMWTAEARQLSAGRLLSVLEAFKYVPVKIKGIS